VAPSPYTENGFTFEELKPIRGIFIGPPLPGATNSWSGILCSDQIRITLPFIVSQAVISLTFAASAEIQAFDSQGAPAGPVIALPPVDKTPVSRSQIVRGAGIASIVLPLAPLPPTPGVPGTAPPHLSIHSVRVMGAPAFAMAVARDGTRTGPFPVQNGVIRVTGDDLYAVEVTTGGHACVHRICAEKRLKSCLESKSLRSCWRGLKRSPMSSTVSGRG